VRELRLVRPSRSKISPGGQAQCLSYNGDGGTLFIMATIVFVASAVALYLHRKDVPVAALRGV
jgi:hypothetical protein